MTWWHPNLGRAGTRRHAGGRRCTKRRRRSVGRTGTERGYIAALDAFYAKPATKAPGESGQSCHGRRAAATIRLGRSRTQRDGEAAGAVSRDIEIAAFRRLALLGTAPPAAQDTEDQRQATEILASLREDTRIPGIIHYLIHGYDYPQVAQKGLLRPKRTRGSHRGFRMPFTCRRTIFTRLGMWRRRYPVDLDPPTPRATTRICDIPTRARSTSYMPSTTSCTAICRGQDRTREGASREDACGAQDESRGPISP